MLGHYVKWQDQKTLGKKTASSKTAIEKKMERWNKAIDTMIVTNDIEGKERQPSSSKRAGSGLMQRVDKIQPLDPKLMVPIVYPATMKVQPCNETAEAAYLK